MVERLAEDEGVAGSNPALPTMDWIDKYFWFMCGVASALAVMLLAVIIFRS